MRLRVQLFASLRERARASELDERDLPEPLDVAGLKRELERRHPELGSLAHVRGVVGTSYARDDAQLADGATVALLPPVSGGAPDRGEDLARGVFELARGPLDPLAAQRRVEHTSCGAVVVFTGTTRDRARGQRVVRLDYEAFEAMAGPEMGRIFERCRGELGADDGARALRMLAIHRVGSIEVGEASVVIAVASPHRELAFRACRFLIDELKRSLPVWKKEIYDDGAEWIGDRS
jgi:molybdopterin synthase catalytic subunit